MGYNPTLFVSEFYRRGLGMHYKGRRMNDAGALAICGSSMPCPRDFTGRRDEAGAGVFDSAPFLIPMNLYSLGYLAEAFADLRQPHWAQCRAGGRATIPDERRRTFSLSFSIMNKFGAAELGC